MYMLRVVVEMEGGCGFGCWGIDCSQQGYPVTPVPVLSLLAAASHSLGLVPCKLEL